MHLHACVVASSLALFIAVSAIELPPLPPNFDRYAPISKGITWKGCMSDGDKSKCGRFEVPLDYKNATAGKASLLVMRYPATKEPKLGTLFLNPGGPGISIFQYLLNVEGLDAIMKSGGGQYDLVGWDPRGVGMSYPQVSCFESDQKEKDFWPGPFPRVEIEAPGRFRNQQDSDDYYAQVPKVDKLTKDLGQKCLDDSHNTLQYVGTAATVRDMVALHDYLEPNRKLLNFWGQSYGTVIGIYFANMFPDRVGRVVLDGVVDPEYYAKKPPHESHSISAQSAGEAFTGFLTGCLLAGPSKCVLATKGTTVDSLRDYIIKLLDRAYDYRRAHSSNLKISSDNLRNSLFRAMYSPKRWSQWAQNFLGFEKAMDSGMSSTIAELELQGTSGVHWWDDVIRPDYSAEAITCGDAVDTGNVTTKMVFVELLRVMQSVNQIFGPMWGNSFYCHQWPVRAVERYTGPWNKKLSNKILIIGNTADPATPLHSAEEVARQLGDSAVLIEQSKYGHVSSARDSKCTSEALNNYLVKNHLPSQRLTCLADDKLFDPKPETPEGAPGTDHEKSGERSGSLSSPVVALACAMGLALIFLLVSRVRGQKAKTAPPATYFAHRTTEKTDEEQGDHLGALCLEPKQNGDALVVA